jgi:hypothetical protein
MGGRAEAYVQVTSAASIKWSGYVEGSKDKSETISSRAQRGRAVGGLVL